MPRLQYEFLERVEHLCDRVLDVAEELGRQRRSFRILDQIIGSGSAIGANLFEAAEAMSKADFVKCLAIANKELNETMFWIRLVGRREWITADRLGPLENELLEIKRIIGTMIARTKANPRIEITTSKDAIRQPT